MSNFDSTKTALAELLKGIVEGKIQLPDFQRGWVWNDDSIRSLLVSIARTFPVGAVMMLEAGGETRFKVRPVEGLDPNQLTPDRAEQLILDGQQRLTSLTQVLMLQQPVATRTATRKAIKRYYYIDIETALLGPEYYEEAIISIDETRTTRKNFGKTIDLDLSTAEREYEKFYFPFNQILNSDAWEEGLLNHAPTKFTQFMKFRGQFVKAFREYAVPVIELNKNNTKEAVCLVFEKVNTGGVPLSVFELVTATYAADGVNLRDEWYGNEPQGITGIQKQLYRQRLLRNVQTTDFLQGISLLYTWEKRQSDMAAGKTGKQVTGISAKREAVLSLPVEAFKWWQDKLTAGFENAAKFLRRESFFSTRDLPYNTQLVPLAAVLTLLGNDWLQPVISEKLVRWYWCGVLGELYGSTTESRFASDLQGLMDWIRREDAPEPTTVRDANFQPARLYSLSTRNSAAYKGINVLVQREGAQDFFWKSAIRDLDATDWEECKLDIHHIFPQKWCQDRGITRNRYNCILNKTPISYKANRMIGGRSPSAYLQQLQQHPQVQLDDTSMDVILKTHAIDPHYLRNDDFEGFLSARQQTLLKKIELAMGKPVAGFEAAIAGEYLDDESE
ncbi:MAG: DUF262 domain-containing protein [Leptolyngbyaceae cyanobacterium]